MERPPMPRCDYCGRDVDTAAEPYTSVPSGPDAGGMRLGVVVWGRVEGLSAVGQDPAGRASRAVVKYINRNTRVSRLGARQVQEKSS